MFRSYFKVGIRNLLRHRSHTLINITGLASGIACVLFIVLYIADELSYDRYHEKSDRIFRVATDSWAKMPPALAPALMESYPHVVDTAVRLWPLFAPAKIRRGETAFVEQGGVFADAGVFSVFTWPILAGDESTALSRPRSIVFTESMAKKYFGETEAVGQSVTFWGQDMTVTAVMQDVPPNSHLQFDFLVSFSTLQNVMGRDIDENWGLPAFFTYVLMTEGATPADLDGAARSLFARHGFTSNASPNIQPLESIHLYSDLEGEFASGGNLQYLYMLGSAAFIVLLLACINFVNLTTARAATRAKEVGIRKVMGALRGQLVGQFFGEALIMTVVSFFLATMLVNLALPQFNLLTGKMIEVSGLFNPFMAAALIAAVALIAIVAGAYPAIFLSRYRPVLVLKGTGGLGASNPLVRKALIVLQFSLSTSFLICMATVLLQLRYLHERELGFDKEQVLVLDADNFTRMRDALQSVPGVEAVAGVPQVLGGNLPGSPYKAEGVIFDSMKHINHFGVTEEFVETMGIELVAGRSFVGKPAAEQADAFILNESAVRSLGWQTAEDAIGKTFSIAVPPLEGGDDVWRAGEVVGVVKDFNYDALYSTIQPLVLYPSYDLNLTFVRVSRLDPGIIEGIRNVWRNVNPESPFNYYSLDSHLKQKYLAEQKLGSFMAGATVLAVLIACLGLFALVSFTAARRTKEIGIRKVLGASVTHIILLMASDFLKLVLLAVVVAIPVAQIVVSRWLDNFAYHIELSWMIFAAAGLFAFLIALLTVSGQSLKAASADPVESLKYE